MTAACELCGELISGREVRFMNGGSPIDPKSMDPEAIAIQNFDLLAAAMTHHLSLRHQKETGEEMMAIMHLAAKVYAMTWSTSSVENFDALRKAWRSAIVTELGKDKSQAAAPAAAPAALGGGASVAPR